MFWSCDKRPAGCTHFLVVGGYRLEPFAKCSLSEPWWKWQGTWTIATWNTPTIPASSDRVFKLHQRRGLDAGASSIRDGPVPSAQYPRAHQRNTLRSPGPLLNPPAFNNMPVRLVVHGGACMLLHPDLDRLASQTPLFLLSPRVVQSFGYCLNDHITSTRRCRRGSAHGSLISQLSTLSLVMDGLPASFTRGRYADRMSHWPLGILVQWQQGRRRFHQS